MKVIMLTMLVLAVLLTGCVTETEGGFNVETSEEKALQSYIQLSMGYLEQGELASTRRHLENAMAIDSKNSDVHAIWGLLQSREGDIELADKSFKQALRLDSKNSRARNNYAAFLFANSRFEEAYKELEKVVVDTQYPARPQAFENMGLAALRLNELEDAEYAFGRAIQLNGNQLGSILELVDISLVKNNVPQATNYYNNLTTVMQFFKVAPSARTLWLGIKLEQAQDGSVGKINEYAELLEENFPNSAEYKLYQQSLSGSGKHE